MEKRTSPAKVVVLGEGNSSNLNVIIARVGKTSLTLRYCKSLFNERQETSKDATCLEKEVMNAAG